MASDWTTRKVAELMHDATLEIGDGYRAKNAELASDGIPFARAGNINGGFDFSKADRVPAETLARVGKKRSRVGDVVFTSKGTVGRFALVDDGVEPFVLSPQLCYWRSLKPSAISPRFLFFWFHGGECLHQLDLLKGQTDMADYVSLRDQHTMSVTLPPPDEQRAIASVLGALDDKAESNRRLVAAQRQTRSLRFTDLCRNRSSRVPLEAVAEHLKGTVLPAATPAEAFEQFSIPAFDATGDPKVCLGRTMASGKTPLPSEPVVLISKLNPRIPRIWAPVASGVGRAVCSPEFLVLHPKPDISHAWLDACVRHDERFYNDLLAAVTGTTGSRQRVKPSDVMAATVPDATADEIAEWTAFAGPMFGREGALDRERRTLTAIRDALLPKLVSGQIRVPLSDDPEEQVGAATDSLETAGGHPERLDNRGAPDRGTRSGIG